MKKLYLIIMMIGMISLIIGAITLNSKLETWTTDKTSRDFFKDNNITIDIQDTKCLDASCDSTKIVYYNNRDFHIVSCNVLPSDSINEYQDKLIVCLENNKEYVIEYFTEKMNKEKPTDKFEGGVVNVI